MDYEVDYQKLLDCISPSLLDRTEWVKVGMALKYEGVPFEVFDDWSRGDARPGQYKGTDKTRVAWDSFKNMGSGTVTGATLTRMAREQGHEPFAPAATGFFDWADLITSDGEEPGQYAAKSQQEPRTAKKSVFQIIDYLETLFKPDDHINVVTSSFYDDGKYKPYGTGVMTLTVQDYLDGLRKGADKPDFFDEVFGSYDHSAGVWVRINPITGTLEEGQKGISDRNITRWENALIECDEYSTDEQIRRIKELGLPYRALVYSGSRSIHAIIKVDGKSLADYKEKVSWLQEYCIAKGLPVDTQNKNPSRLSRLPGVDRGDKHQTLLEIDKHPIPFDEFRRNAQAEEEAKSLEIEPLDDVFTEPPELSPEVVHSVLRRGHKMLISGPSKAGKSFNLISLAIAAAEGTDWMGFPVEAGKVLYLNLEIDRPSFIKRVIDVYKAKNISPENVKNIHVINMRGMAEPLSELAPKLEYIVKKQSYELVIIDPIYKVITGDENSAGDMGKFCNLFDKIAKAGNCAVAYCHHHSKGTQANKSAIDRASGSGVFARDPDAIVDMTEISVSDVDREEIKARVIESVYDEKLKDTGQWDKMSDKEKLDRIGKQELVRLHFQHYPDDDQQAFYNRVDEAETLGDCPAYRINFTLREFKSPSDRNVFFKYPIHITDPTGVLEGLFLDGDNSIEALNKAKQEKVKKRSDEKRAWYDEQRKAGKMVSPGDLANHFDVSEKTARRWADSQEGIIRDKTLGWILYEGEEPPKEARTKGSKH